MLEDAVWQAQLVTAVSLTHNALRSELLDPSYELAGYPNSQNLTMRLSSTSEAGSFGRKTRLGIINSTTGGFLTDFDSSASTSWSLVSGISWISSIMVTHAVV